MYKVSLVEDEELILQGIDRIIDWEGLGLTVVHKAHDGVEALKLWEKEPADIIITDINMPEMDGLQLIEELQKRSKNLRFIILSGYDEFEYARRAIGMKVEEYILKPIDEEKLEGALKKAINSLEQYGRQRRETIDFRTKLEGFVNGDMETEEYKNFLESIGIKTENSGISIARMKLQANEKTINMQEKLMAVLAAYEADNLYAFYLKMDEILLLRSVEYGSITGINDYYGKLQNKLEENLKLATFITVAPLAKTLEELPFALDTMKSLEKYFMIEGYGSCIDLNYIVDRKTNDILVDEGRLHKLLLGGDKKAAVDYIEDLFINNAGEEKISVDALFQMIFKLSMILQEIMEEFDLVKLKKRNTILKLVDKLNQAEHISTIKSLFTSEIIDIMDELHKENSKLTPVIKQLLKEIQEDYKGDFNLKTLAHKYHMNTSYLGQLFQKEMGCSFSQYVTNYKNSIARELILNTNMRINDIAKEVGFTDTSYFYRKFKQCYGISPASLREMKEYNSSEK